MAEIFTTELSEVLLAQIKQFEMMREQQIMVANRAFNDRIRSAGMILASQAGKKVEPTDVVSVSNGILKIERD